MTRTFVKAITAAALISGAALASQPAFAMGFKNCTGEQIRVKIYNNHDVSRAIAKRNKTLGVNDYHWFKLDSDLYQVAIFRSRVGKDTRVHLKGGLNGGHKFSVRKSRGRYYISTTNDCSNAKPTPQPIKTIQVDKGKWKSGRKNFRIRNVTGNSFELRAKGAKRWTLYRLVGRDRYTAGNNTFVMTSRGQATWNGVRYSR